MKRKDYAGQMFSRLTATKFSHTTNGRTFWFFDCACGNTKIIGVSNVQKGYTQSCGCLVKDIASKRFKTHGGTGTRLHNIWMGIKSRCNNPNSTRYSYYGAKGISIYSKWNADYVIFRDWAMSNGYTDELTIDRIDSSGDYVPNNCRWATTKEQANNKSTNHSVTYNGTTMNLGQWAKKFSIHPTTLLRRLAKMPIEEVFMSHDEEHAEEREARKKKKDK